MCNTKSGVLEYCLREELRNKVASHAIKSKAGTWLEHIQSSPLLDIFPANQRLIILGLLAFDTLEPETAAYIFHTPG